MKICAVITGFCLGASLMSAEARIPSRPSTEKGWDGPGYLCEAHFTLKVEHNEYVREDIQLEPWYTPSDTVKSSKGWFTIMILDAGEKDSYREGELVESSESGSLLRYKPEPYSQISALYVHVPSKKGVPAIRIEFFKADHPDPGYPNWRVIPQKSYPPFLYRQVLNRIDFANRPQADCLNRR